MLETAVVTTPIKVKKIGHLVYEVSDLERAVRFWTEIMGFKVSDRNEKGMVFLRNATDHHSIGLMQVDGTKLPLRGKHLQMSHLAMEVADAETLFKARDFIKQQGIKLTSEGRKGPGGNIGIEFEDPDGYIFELYADMDQVGSDGKSRPSSQWGRVTSLEEAVAKPLPKGW
jgi:catechol 2,3-dioxygenase-like lactoylglutathione lyase family enzyme